MVVEKCGVHLTDVEVVPVGDRLWFETPTLDTLDDGKDGNSTPFDVWFVEHLLHDSGGLSGHPWYSTSGCYFNLRDRQRVALDVVAGASNSTGWDGSLPRRSPIWSVQEVPLARTWSASAASSWSAMFSPTSIERS